MLVKFMESSFSDHLLSIGFTSESQLHLTPGREYEVFSIAEWNEDKYYCVILDVNIPCWIPSTVFGTVNDQIPGDWKHTKIGDELDFLLGPEQLVQDEASYIALVSLEPDAVTRFWEYVDSGRDL
jgi:hypothetical protein